MALQSHTKVADDWHELIALQRILQPPIDARKDDWFRGAACTHISAPLSLHPNATLNRPIQLISCLSEGKWVRRPEHYRKLASCSRSVASITYEYWRAKTHHKRQRSRLSVSLCERTQNREPRAVYGVVRIGPRSVWCPEVVSGAPNQDLVCFVS